MKNMTIEQFAMQTASNEPVPGGGSISALAGALSSGSYRNGGRTDNRKEKICRSRRRNEGGCRAYA